MSLQKKYWYQFISRDQNLTDHTHIVELWQETATVITAEEVEGMSIPFKVIMPEIDHKFQVVRGTGCEINMLSDTNMKFWDNLYHVDPVEYQVIHKIDGTVNWLGYLNTEMFRESYDQSFNYPVQITGNDGFALMDRFSFVQLSGANYTGLKSQWELLQIIFDRIGLPWTEVLISLSTTFTGYSGLASSTPLHESYVDCANFYDEDNKPMTLRKVCESILAPYGAFINSYGGKIYIQDIHTLAGGGNITYKRFSASTYAYIAGTTFTNEKAIGTIGYRGTGQQIEMSGGINRQVVAYSPYPVDTVYDEAIAGINEFTTVPATWSTKDSYYYKTLAGNDYITEASPATFETSYFDSTSNTNVYFRWPRITTNQKVAEYKTHPYLTVRGAELGVSGTRKAYYNGLGIKITGEILVKTKNNPYDDTQTSKDILQTAISLRVSIGNKYYVSERDGWSTTAQNTEVWTSQNPNAVIADQFLPIGFGGNGVILTIADPNSTIEFSGTVAVEIWSDYQSFTSTTPTETNSTDIQEIWVRNLKFELVNLDGTAVSGDDIEYIGNLDSQFQNEGQKITLNCGTDAYLSDRGKLLQYDGSNYSDITEWTRAGQSFKIEELLLGSVSSNYQAGFITLSGMKLNNSFNLNNVLTDTFIPGKKMMVKSSEIDYRNNTNQCDLVEISTDNLTIQL